MIHAAALGFSFTGQWNCAGHFANGKPHQSVYTGSSLWNGAVTELQETDTQPKGYVGMYFISYDKPNDRLVLLQPTNMGSAAYVSQDGWQNNKAVFTATPAFQLPASSRFVYSVNSATSFSVDWQMQSKGQWKTGDSLTCTHA